MSLTNIEGEDGSLFTINGRKYIYAGLQKDKSGKKVHTFYGLDGLDNNDKIDLTGFSINSAENETKKDANESVLQMVKSSLYGEYITGIPAALRRAPGFPGPAAFYEIPGANATPTKLNKITEKEKMLDPTSPNYVYRIGSNGPSVEYISSGKINNLKSFMNDYNKMILKKPLPRDKEPVLSVAQGLSPSIPATPTQTASLPPQQEKVKSLVTEALANVSPTQGSSSTQTAPLTPQQEKIKNLVKEALTNVSPTQGSTPTQTAPLTPQQEKIKNLVKEALAQVPNISAPIQVPNEESPNIAAPIQVPNEESPNIAAPIQVPNEESPKPAAPTQVPNEESPNIAAPIQVPNEESPKPATSN